MKDNRVELNELKNNILKQILTIVDKEIYDKLESNDLLGLFTLLRSTFIVSALFGSVLVVFLLLLSRLDLKSFKY